MLERIVHKMPKSSWKKDLGYNFLSLYLTNPSPLTGYFWMVDGCLLMREKYKPTAIFRPSRIEN